MRCRADTLVRTISVGPTNWYGFPKRDAVHDAVKKKRYSNSRSRNLLPSLHDAFDNFIRVFFQDFFPVLCPVTASGLVDLEEPDCIIRPKFLHQYVEAFLLDLMQCFGAHHFPSFNLVTGFSICTCMFRCDLKNVIRPSSVVRSTAPALSAQAICSESIASPPRAINSCIRKIIPSSMSTDSFATDVIFTTRSRFLMSGIFESSSSITSLVTSENSCVEHRRIISCTAVTSRRIRPIIWSSNGLHKQQTSI